MRTLVVVPTYQEAGNIRETLDRLRAHVPDGDILVVDDNSPDGTADIARAAAAEMGGVDVIVRARKDGLGSAYRDGFQTALDRGYDAIVQIDADLSWDAAALPELLARLDAGNEMVIGSRYVAGGEIPRWPWYRRALSRYGNRYACWVLGMPIHDATSGFRAYRADALKAIDVPSTRSRGYGFQIETGYRMCRHTLAVDEVPVIFTDRTSGDSKLSLYIAVEELLLATLWGIRDRVVRVPRSGRR